MQEMILAKVVVHKDLLIKLIKILFFARPSDEGGLWPPFLNMVLNYTCLP